MTGLSSTSQLPLRTAICTLGVGPHRELLDLARPSIASFADRHGYDVVEHHRLLAADRPASWSKVVAIHQLVSDFDRVIWIDADALVVDPSVDLAAELRPGRILGAVVHRYDGNELPNLGVALWRGGRRSARLLQRMWACTDLIDHPWWENAALLRLLGYRTLEPVQRVRPRVARFWLQPLDQRWNTIPAMPHADPWILHLAGSTHTERVTRMAEFALQNTRKTMQTHCRAELTRGRAQ